MGLLRHGVGDPLRVVGDPLRVVGEPLVCFLKKPITWLNEVIPCVPNGILVGLSHITVATYMYLQNISQARIKITTKFRTKGVDRSRLTLTVLNAL